MPTPHRFKVAIPVAGIAIASLTLLAACSPPDTGSGGGSGAKGQSLAVAETKALVRTLDLAQCRAIAAQALAAPDAPAVRALVSSLSEQGQ